MPSSFLDRWLTEIPIDLLGLALLVCMIAAAIGGRLLKTRQNRRTGAESRARSDELDGVIVSAMLGLLALLLGFTFALAADRFETRRLLVIQEANAIGTTYLRAQLLQEPHRSRISGILVAYADNRLALAAATGASAKALSAKNDRLITDLWAATAAAFDSIRGAPFANSLLEATNRLIDLDAERRAARATRVPDEVFVVLVVYMIVTAAALGFVVVGVRAANSIVGVMLVLLTVSLMLVLDIDEPSSGRIREDEAPMEALRASLTAQPPQVFDRWRTPDGATGTPAPKATSP